MQHLTKTLSTGLPTPATSLWENLISDSVPALFYTNPKGRQKNFQTACRLNFATADGQSGIN
ncbi:hypothetical protein, partial [Neisseria sp. P0009.S003]|uniref:hypothetical protein n=1 Tax=Neisseria sp. P0009.S003 TaxID=3436710 RepID=UPI003F81AF4F